MRMEATVPPEYHGKALKTVLRGVFQLSAGQYKRAKFEGEICLRGARAHVNATVCAGDAVSVSWPERALPQEVLDRRMAQEGQSLPPLAVLFEDEHLLVLDKPAPMPSVASPHQTGITVEDLVLSHLGRPQGFVYRPVNRLDKGTSGLMLVAKTAWAQQRMQAMLHTDAFVREYLAVADGVPNPPTGEIALPIGKAPGATVRRCILSQSDGGKPCRTAYHVLSQQNGRALLRLKLYTGRTHQIRVHLSAIGTPVCGDFLYGTELPNLPRRFALHSASLRFVHPLTGQEITLESPLPTALAKLLEPEA